MSRYPDMDDFRAAVARQLAADAARDERSGMSTQFEADVRAMFAGLAPGALAALERDLRGDLAAKQAQLDRIEAKLDRALLVLDPRPGEHRTSSVPLYPNAPDH